MLRNEDIDAAILAELDDHWSKVAAMVIDVSNALGRDDDWTYWQVADRIKRLAEKGRIDSQGNLDNWRRSEVRLLFKSSPSE